MQLAVLRRQPHGRRQVGIGRLQPPGRVMCLGPRMIGLKLMGIGRDDLGGDIDGLSVGLQLALAARQVEQQVHTQLVKDLLLLLLMAAGGGKAFDGVGVAQRGLGQLTALVERVAVLQQLVQQRQPENTRKEQSVRKVWTDSWLW